jgi:phosphatidate phosphatase LPIN
MGPSTTAEDGGSMPGSFDSRGEYMQGRQKEEDRKSDEEDEGESDGELDRNDSFDDDAIFDDDILAAGEMKNVPF